MPFTFCHPLAILPFRRLCPLRLNAAALVIGSLSPDFGYFVRQNGPATLAHTLPGVLMVCLPSGLAALGLVLLLRRSLCFALPQPHRAALLPVAMQPVERPWRNVLAVAVSLILGAWTHVVWDSFTHAGGWAVTHVALLQTPVCHLGRTAIPLFCVLQHTSTFAAGTILLVLYVRWLRRQPAPPPAADSAVSDRTRYALLAAQVALAIVVAAPIALQASSAYAGLPALRVFPFRACVHFIAVFTTLFAASSMLLYEGYSNHTCQTHNH